MKKPAPPTLASTQHGRCEFQAGLRVATLSGPRRYGVVDIADPAVYGMPRGSNGAGTHIPVVWNDGRRAAWHRLDLEKLPGLPGTRVKHTGTGRCGFIHSRSCGRRYLYLTINGGTWVLVRWDGGKLEPEEESNLIFLTAPA
jgi:hypothetical protein